MAGRPDGMSDWAKIMAGFGIALVVETFVFIFAGFDVQTWQVGFIAIQAFAFATLALVKPSWQVKVQMKENELINLQAEIKGVERRVNKLELGDNYVAGKTVDENLDGVLDQLMKGTFNEKEKRPESVRGHRRPFGKARRLQNGVEEGTSKDEGQVVDGETGS